ncbi:MAG: DEAD/DEAH box helicase [Schleiferiaceae bacterium]|jgi:superfamily II DNA/RNA helicase|nr:DEAD/DEAH box helicase [Schleiferiaceae bacterium]
MTFEELGLHEEVINAIGYMGFENATPIQEQAIPEIIKGKDLIACAQTGTGKTAAFMLPILHKLASQPHKGTNTLIIVPTRELAVQIDQQIQGFSYFLSVSSCTVYGGGDGGGYDAEKKALKEGVDIVVATPGKLKSHIKMGLTYFDNLEHLILDEADRMMDMGFIDDIMFIISKLPKKRQNLMFSATMAPKVREVVRKVLYKPFEINIAISKPAEGVTQEVYLTYPEQKIRLIRRILKQHEDFTSIIVFSSTKKDVFSIVRGLNNRGFKAEGISSDLEQKEREEVLSKFRSRDVRIVVATDVLSRGIDIKEINLVINYSIPTNAEDYVHRVGRTARSDAKGMAITLVEPRDMKNMNDIEQLIGYQIERKPLPEDLGAGPEWKLPERKKKRKNFRRNNRGNGKNNKGNFRPKNKGNRPKPKGEGGTPKKS